MKRFLWLGLFGLSASALFYLSLPGPVEVRAPAAPAAMAAVPAAVAAEPAPPPAEREIAKQAPKAAVEKTFDPNDPEAGADPVLRAKRDKEESDLRALQYQGQPQP